MELNVNEKKFSLKYSILYTIIIVIILIIPFAIYDRFIYNLEEAKTEIALKKKSIQIINEMENFDNQIHEFFSFPRYKSFQAGLYNENANPIFSLINLHFSSLDLTPGYHKMDGFRYYVTKFDNKKYFNSSFLVVNTKFNIYGILENILIIFLSILIIVFLFSFTILKNFAKPFQQINNTLDDFIKDAMHEINTPLSIININVDMYSEKFGQNKYFSRIKSASKILSTIYDDMNYIIKENTINKTEKETINFSNFLKKSIDYFKDIAELKGITIIADIEEDIFIDFIPTKLQKIIDNNLSNAIKYSKEEQEVLITLKKENNSYLLGFTDHGIGIKDVESIFSRYYREDHTKGGFGIGLNIVGKICTEENIQVKILSDFGKGSYFEYKFSANRLP